MDILKQLNAAIAYIEANLCEEIETEELSRITCVTKDSFLRFFSYMTGVTLKEYIRRRRLTLAAYELRASAGKVIDLAVKYGYENGDSFTKAFVKQHKLTPTEARDLHRSLKVYPPISFHMMIKGAEEMDFRLIEQPETEVFGVSRPFDGQGYKSREELRHNMWAEEGEDVPGQICEGRWNQPDSHTYDGVWYGIWQDGCYMIARAKEDAQKGALQKQMIKAGTYAAFRTERGGLAWEELPKLRELIFDSWLPSADYRLAGDTVIEILHLWTDREERNKKRYYEIWIPVEKK